MEENMDPPSFSKTLIQKNLMIENEMDELHKIMEEKATKIEEKLIKIE